MPCRYDDDPSADYARVRNELDLVTRLLCEATTDVPRDKWSPELKAWREKHDAMDEERRAREEAERNAEIAKVEASMRHLQARLDALKDWKP